MFAMVGAHSASCASSLIRDCLFDIGHDLIELMDRVVPLFRVEFVEGFRVIALEVWARVALECGERSRIPEDQVIGELTDGVVAFAVLPVGLLGREVGDGDIGADEPVALVVRAVQLVEQDGAEGGCGLRRCVCAPALRVKASARAIVLRTSDFMRLPRKDFGLSRVGGQSSARGGL